MNKFPLFCLTSLFSLACGITAFGDDLQEMYSPKNVEEYPSSAPQEPPTPQVPQNENETVILEETKGLLLVGDPSLVVKRVDTPFEGVTIMGIDVPDGEKKLIRKLTPLFQNQRLTQKLISKIKREIVMYYRRHHHPLVMVLVPEQEISHGVLQLVVIESRLGKLCVQGTRYTPAIRVEKWVRAKPGETIDEEQLIRDVDWINSNPFRQVNIVYAPGEQRGTTDIKLRIADRKPWRIYTGGDNTGTPNIGSARLFAGVNFNNAFFPDNLFSYQYTTASNMNLFQSHTAQYQAPLPWRHNVSLFGGYASVNPDIEPFKSHGKSYQFSVRYGAPFWFAHPTFVNAVTPELGFDFKGTNNNVLFGEDNPQVVQQTLVNIAQFVFGAHANMERGRQKIAMGIDLYWSPGSMISHQTKEDFESLRAGATARYFYGKLSFQHKTPLFANWSIVDQLRLQLTDANLLASEQFALGGYSTVRGYDERVVNGDSAVCFNFELHTPSVAPLTAAFRKLRGEALYFLAFFDVGHAWDHEQIPGFPKKQTLIGIGPGLRYHIGSYLSTRLDVGFPLHSIQGHSEHTRLHFSATLNY